MSAAKFHDGRTANSALKLFAMWLHETHPDVALDLENYAAQRAQRHRADERSHLVAEDWAAVVDTLKSEREAIELAKVQIQATDATPSVLEQA